MKLIVMGAGYVGLALLNHFQNKTYEISITTTKEDRVEELQPYGKNVLVLHPCNDHTIKELIEKSDRMIILTAPKNPSEYKESYLKSAERISSILQYRKTPLITNLTY